MHGLLFGAVVRGLGGNQVGQRIARCHYVVTFVEEYNSRLHSARDKYWDAVTETWCVDGRMKWYIEKGKPISEDEPIRMSWHQHVSKVEAPDHLTEEVFEVCTLKADLSAIPPSLFHSCTNSLGQIYYDVAFEIAMTSTSPSILFDLEFNGVSSGSVQAKY
ncbi:hypothetical protein KXV52_004356 [Aspergillus fumigatus]|nr:hypothetical protein KXV97_005517 [Aspergillus fumigatus]KAH3155114.1 hypothetical protein KXW80_007477 [Aspergillus fumigatus]KAH3362337.1 hypothetical protein KXV52_004356 [Aspergillus fumigatus]